MVSRSFFQGDLLLESLMSRKIKAQRVIQWLRENGITGNYLALTAALYAHVHGHTSVDEATKLFRSEAQARVFLRKLYNQNEDMFRAYFKLGPITKKHSKQKPKVKIDYSWVKSDEFLTSWEWTKLRYIVIQKYGRKCLCCGLTPADGIKINVDHIKARSTHPELALEESNLQVLCNLCNKGKGAWDSTDFRKA